MKILVIKTSSMGDLVHCLPAVTDIVNQVPGAKIHWLAEHAFTDVAHMHPAICKVHVCAMRLWRNNLLSRQTWQEICQLRNFIKQQNYDLAIDFQGLLKSACWTLGSGAESHGYDRLSIREPLSSMFYSKRHRVKKNLHAIERNRLLAAAAMGYSLSSVVDFGIQIGKCRKKQVLFLHGTSRISKELPTESWCALAQLFSRKGYRVLVPWHSDREHDQARCIASAGGHLLDRMTIAALVSHIAESKMVVAVDTGLAHLSCALNIPTLALFVTGNPLLTGVIGDHCLNITAEEMQHSYGKLQPAITSDKLLQVDFIFQKALALMADNP